LIGIRLMSDMTHYMRSGDFVQTLLAESQSLNEYAFALGSLAHYAADSTGHPVINRIIPQVYFKLRARFGDVVTYADHPVDHLKTEFAPTLGPFKALGFLVDRLSHRHYETATPALRTNILEYFRRMEAANIPEKTSGQPEELRNATAVAAGGLP
jgi:hypothetical protein